MKGFWKGFVAGFIGNAVLAVLWFSTGPGPSKAPAGAMVKENPVAQERGRADLNLTTNSAGTLQGKIILPQNPGVPVTPALPPAGMGIPPLPPGIRLTVPVTGMVHTVYRDGRTGVEIGTGDHPVAGQTALTFTPEWLQTETSFQETATIAVFLPEHPWRVALSDRGLELAWRRRIHRNLFGEAELERGFDGDWRLGFRMELEF